MLESSQKGGIQKKMSQKLPKPISRSDTGSETTIQTKLESLLENVGDMSLKRRARRIIEELSPAPKEKIIDLGCGDGYYLYLLSNLPVDLSLTGLDNDKVALSNAKNNLQDKKIKILHGNLLNLPFENESFDKVILTEVIEHIDDDLAALKEIKRVLKEEGCLVLTTTSIDYPFLWDPVNWILMRLFNTHIKKGFWAGIWFNHDKLYRTQGLKKLIQKAGFEVELVEELTTWCLPFNHYIVNLVARLLYDYKLPINVTAPVSKFKDAPKPLWVRIAFFGVNLIDKLNELLPGEHGVNILVKAKKPS